MADLFRIRLGFVRHCYDVTRRRDVTVDERECWRTGSRPTGPGCAVGYRILGSVSEADDAVQQALLRLSRSDTSGVENLDGWLTTVVARVCLDMLRARTARREEPLGPRVPEPIVSREDEVDPQHAALLTDSVGLALLVVLETLAPAERLAFVLHATFAVPFDQIAPIVGRSPPPRDSSQAARGAGYRGLRRRPTPIPPASARWSTRSSPPHVAATSTRSSRCSTKTPCFGSTAARSLIASREVRGAQAVLEQTRAFVPLVASARPALVNGAAGVVVARRGRPLAVAGFTVAHGQIVEIDLLADPARLRELDLPFSTADR
jgi:RNA polymerase sigma-70 factor (ECF subfamily)